MLDCIQRNEAEPDVVQISGGEPTIHPEFFAILDEARRRPIKHLMLNTNGVRIAADAGFARRLKDYQPGFEVYLQFDSLREAPLRALRGEDLRDVRRKALDRLNEHNISTTLVCTLKKGLNDDEIGAIIDFALQQRCVRGITFQPIQAAGRLEEFDPARDRLTLGEVRQRILEQAPVFKPADILPVPCHPDCLAMAYAFKNGSQIIPLTGMIDPQLLLHGEGNTIVYERDPRVRDMIRKLTAGGGGCCSAAPAVPDDGAAGGAAEGIMPRDGAGQALAPPSGSARNSTSLKQILCCLPMFDVPPDVKYDNIFRIIIMQFLDAYNFDVRSVKKSCVHIVHPDGRIIPFDTFNMFYRDGREQTLAGLRGEAPMSAPVPLTVSARGG
jgi:hypothetical protein